MDKTFALMIGVVLLGSGVGLGYIAHKSEKAVEPDVRSLLKQKTKYLHESDLVRVIDPGAEVVCYIESGVYGSSISCLPIQLMGKADDEETP